MKRVFKIGEFCMVMSAVAGVFMGCAGNSITPNEPKFSQCYNQETNTAKNCETMNFKELLESKEEWKIHSYHFKGNTITLEKQVENSPILRFHNQEINGTLGCNQFFGGYLIEGNHFNPINIGMTRKMCEPKTMEHEDTMVRNFLNTPTKILVVEEVKGMSKIFFIGKDFYIVLN
ncbi:META domain-containing protein [Helicobacter sp.]|uniref:META domain-containing protein n=1 Tax=Helicobacter sp. TaxID=218 RepID=UPI0019C434EE|nr:META domain-containing protein [Helicobacter sp.]MBD5165331.1 META domain-containing protein [Helicobacter sp.]